MDRRAPATPAQRDIMFCHSCDNEWYRDEHGLTCPQCEGEFCEIIEATNDPRYASPPSREQEIAPDPDEDDIEQLDWRGNNEPYEQFRARFERTDNQNTTQSGGGIFGLLGTAFRLAGDMIQPHNPSEQAEGPGSPASTHNTMQRSISPDGGTTFTRHMHGNGYSFTMTTTRSSNTLFPRDPHNPQPFQQQPQDVNDIMQQMLANIGALSANMNHSGGQRGMHPWEADSPEHQFGGFGALPLSPAGFLQLLGGTLGGVHGDAVYSQEGLDRIISQLMDQHQSGNAPGPATENAIKSLPKRSITEKDLGESGTAECSICMDSVVLGDTVTVLPCEHWFHFDCIEAWLKEHDTCPHCRQGIMPKDNANANAPRSPSQPPLNDMHSPQNTRSHIPGSYPFPQQGSNRAGASSNSPRREGGQSGGVFDRMREAFAGGSSSSRPR